MSNLMQRIRGLERQNYESNYFITFEDLSAEVTDEDVLRALRSSEVPGEKWNEIAKRVREGALKTFAILLAMNQLRLFTILLRTDEFQKPLFDTRLPLEVSNLEIFFGKTPLVSEITSLKRVQDRSEKQNSRLCALEIEKKNIEGWAKWFFKEQFLYCAPSFQRQSSHRLLRDEMRLPFLPGSEEYLGEGSYGAVYSVKLPGSFIESNDEDIQVARKELMPSGNAYENEVRVLEILRLIQHPNILELYCSYTYRKKHYLLFPIADIDVEELMRRDRHKRPTAFQSDDTFFVALCGLTSALKNVHHYSNLSLNLNMIGCHHDLKPDNILVRGSLFVLADFGISSIKRSEEDSKTQSKGGGDYYAAPESRDYPTFKELRIGRASDIWALGCIIAVVLTYLKLGPSGVDKFEEEREYPVDSNLNYSVHTFHLGTGKPNPAVNKWLDMLQLSCTPSERALLDLVRDMLELEYSDRPGIADVLLQLRFITLQKLSEVVSDALTEVPKSHQDKLVFKIERTTFNEWFSELNSITSANLEHVCKDDKFGVLVKTLQQLRKELRPLTSPNLDNRTYPVFLPIQRLVQQLLSDVTKEMRQSVRSRTEDLILADLESNVNLDSELDKGSESHTRILQLFNLKYMKLQTKEFSGNLPLLDVNDFQAPEDDSYLTFSVRKMNASSRKPEQEFIVETLEYGEDIHDEAAAKQIFNRMINILDLPSQHTALRGLPCSGFYRDGKMFGLVYEIPHPKDNPKPRVRTLAQILSGTRWGEIELVNRFRLALEISKALSEFHKINWMHKGISSHNVVFFAHDDIHARKLEEPFITGFSHSRPNDPFALSNLTQGTQGKMDQLRNFLHPKYRKVDAYTRFILEYDCYSLGIVLLEIGSGKPLQILIQQQVAQGKGTEEIREYLKDTARYLLPSTMGKKYSDAVLACLSDDLVSNEVEKASLKFERLVVRVLTSCSV